jgi:transglutaminase-like putative cysteine protease
MRTALLLLLPALLGAQNEPDYAALRISPELMKNAHAVIRSQEINFTVSAPDEAVLREKRVVTLFNAQSDYDRLVLFYDGFNKIGKIKGSLYDAQGRFIRDIEKKEIEDVSAINHFSIYEESRVRVVDVACDIYPYTVVFEYEVRYHDLRGYPDWDIQDFHTSVEYSSFTVTLPQGMKLFHKELNIKLPPTEKQDGNKHSFRWEAQQLPAIKAELYAPSPFELLPQVLVSPETFKADNYTGSMASWQTFGAFQYELSKGRDVLSPALREKVRSLTQSAGTDAEKIAVLFRYLQENTRYVSVQLGIGGWQPFDALYVEKNKHGDCKALSNFMKALLKEAGITAYPVLVKAGDYYLDLPDDFATSAFNHMILYVPASETWLECTSTSFPPNYLGSGTDDRKVLLITEQGGKLARTPAMTAAVNNATNHTRILLKATGEATIAVRSVLNGALHEWFRSANENLPPDEMKKEMQKQNPLAQAYFSRLAVQPDREKPSVLLDYALDVPQFGSKAGKRLFLPLNPVNAFRDVPPLNEQRVHPVIVRDGYVETDTIILQLPEGFSVESMPAENTVFTTEFGAYSCQVERRDATLQCVRRLEMKPFRLPAERYAEWRNFCRDVAKTDGLKVVLVNKT